MSLVAFHRFLIATGIVFSFGFAGWEFRAFLINGAAGELLIAMLFVVIGAGLSFYLWRLKRFLGYQDQVKRQ